MSREIAELSWKWWAKYQKFGKQNARVEIKASSSARVPARGRHGGGCRPEPEAAAQRLLHAKNEAQQQPLINRQIARAYLAVGDPEITRRTWRNVLNEIIKLKHDATQQRWITAGKDLAFDLIRDLPIFAPP